VLGASIKAVMPMDNYTCFLRNELALKTTRLFTIVALLLVLVIQPGMAQETETPEEDESPTSPQFGALMKKAAVVDALDQIRPAHGHLQDLAATGVGNNGDQRQGDKNLRPQR
jgi:hypothetical protein